MLTFCARVVIIDGFDKSAEKQLLVFLNQARVEGAEMRVLVVNTAKKESVARINACLSCFIRSGI